jgi:hypothetical protein
MKRIGDKAMSAAQRQARYRRKLALKKRKEICERLGIDPLVLTAGIFPRLPSDDVEADDEAAVELEPGDAMTLVTPTPEDWARLIWRPEEG